MMPMTMKMILISLLLVLGATFLGRQNKDSSHTQVGTHPGDIGTRDDILSAARERGHDLASFGAG
jgi:hypothetical protein